jgi:hypothetical protein
MWKREDGVEEVRKSQRKPNIHSVYSEREKQDGKSKVIPLINLHVLYIHNLLLAPL